jgi:hypothetical protein
LSSPSKLVNGMNVATSCAGHSTNGVPDGNSIPSRPLINLLCAVTSM